MKKSVLILMVLMVTSSLNAQQWTLVTDLRGQWKFEIGESNKFADPAFNDSDWEDIFVPSSWEDEGFQGYDGYAWYRKKVKISSSQKGKPLYLHLGNVDDASEVYINGNFLSYAGKFPPHYITAYETYQTHPIPEKYINYDKENVIAVKVFDAQLAGGIVNGKVGLFVMSDYPKMDVRLSETWKFTIGDDMDWKEPGFNDSKWENITVPAYWETQGYEDYDGIAWYRTTFKISAKLAEENLMLMMGKIDDYDEVYVNGKLVGKTGRIPRRDRDFETSEDFREIRSYRLPSELLKTDGENVIAVRVYDGLIQGGIYDGPIGILTKKEFANWEDKRGNRGKYKFLEKLF